MRSRMMSLALSIAAAWVLSVVGPIAQGCNPDGKVQFICGPIGAEDLITVPQSDWVIASGHAAGGGIHAINTRDRTTIKLFPVANAPTRPDRKTYPSCPGPVDPAEGDNFRAHGLAIRPGRNGVHTVWAVHHGNRESVEAFEFDSKPKPPTLTWVGCVVSPETVSGNGLTALPDDGFALTNFTRRNDPNVQNALRSGGITGEVWEWHPGKSWSKVPESESPGPNGVDVSKDGKWFYIGAWGDQTLVRLSRGQTPVKKETVHVNFHIDNVHWAPDGTLLVAGQGGGDATTIFTCLRQQKCGGIFTGVAKVDPNTMKAREIIHYPANDVWTAGTTALQVGKELWVGTIVGNRIARFATP